MTYYLSKTMCATILGMILVSISKPGSYAEKQLCSENITINCVIYEPSHVSTVDTFLDIGRNLCPDNVFAATFQLDKTDIEESTGGALQKKKIKTASPNVLGLISCALLIGICMQLQQTDENVVLVIKLVDGMNKLLMKAVKMIIWGWVAKAIIEFNCQPGTSIA